MMKAETIFVGDDPHTIDVRPITIIVPSRDVPDVRMPDRAVLTPEDTIFHAQRVKRQHVRTPALLAKVFPQPVASKGYLHVLGLIDLTLKLTDMGVPVAWQFPETYLHPAQQLELGDVLVALTNGG